MQVGHRVTPPIYDACIDPHLPLYGLDIESARDKVAVDQITAMKAEYHARGVGRSNLTYGYVVD